MGMLWAEDSIRGGDSTPGGDLTRAVRSRQEQRCMTPDMSVSLADAAADDAPEVAVVAAGAVVADAADVPEAVLKNWVQHH